MIIIPVGMLLFMFVTDENTQMNQCTKWLFEFAVPWCVCVCMHNKLLFFMSKRWPPTSFVSVSRSLCQAVGLIKIGVRVQFYMNAC